LKIGFLKTGYSSKEIDAELIKILRNVYRTRISNRPIAQEQENISIDPLLALTQTLKIVKEDLDVQLNVVKKQFNYLNSIRKSPKIDETLFVELKGEEAVLNISCFNRREL